jgi:hypothetical protein
MRPVALLLILCGTQAPKDPKEKKAAELEVRSFQTLKDAQGRPLLTDWPVWAMDIENTAGRDLEITVRVDEESSRTRITRRESISRGARKRLFFYLPAGAGLSGGAPQYEIRDSAGQKLAGAQASPTHGGLEANAFQVALFSGDKSSSGAFGFPAQMGGLEVGVVRLTPATFPDRWIALSCLDAIILHDAPLDDLAPDQARALAEYVRAGGTAILSPGPDAAGLSHRVISAFVAIRAGTPMERTDLPALTSHFGKFRQADRFVFHRIENGKEIGWGREALQFECGYGLAVVLPYDVRRPPFDTWPGLEKLWESMLGRLPRRFTPETSATLPAVTPEAAINLFQSMALLINPYPSFLLLVALAVIFLIAVGPVNYLILRRLGMTILIVVTVPAISAVFLLLVFATGYILKGTTTVAYSARILSTRAGMDCARETQLFTLFSPSTRTYDVSIAPGTHGLPLDRALQVDRRYSRGDDSGGGNRLEGEDGATFTYKGVSVGQWQSWNLQARAFRDLGSGIHFEVTRAKLKITNLSALPIERGLFIETGPGGCASPFGEVAPGKSIEAPLDRTRRRPYEDLDIARESFAGRMLGPSLDPLVHEWRRTGDSENVRPARALLCLVKEEAPPIRADARLSGSSRSLTMLHVAEAAPK